MKTEKVMENPFFTVFTPVYNGVKTLERVFKSIDEQTYRNFEWIIIDDGSSDNSYSLIEEFINSRKSINITLIKQKNSGKNFAWERAVSLAKGELFVPADQDDYFIPETLEFFYSKWESLAHKEQFSGINVLCFDNDSSKIVGSYFPYDELISNNLELYFKYEITGEKWGCIRTDILKLYKFPTFKGSYYYPFSYLWYKIGQKFKVICYNTPLRRYYTNQEGITQTLIRKIGFKQSFIMLHYYFWLIRKFGLYIFLRKPKNLFITFYITIQYMVSFIKNIGFNFKKTTVK